MSGKDIVQALLDGPTDFAIHSAKVGSSHSKCSQDSFGFRLTPVKARTRCFEQDATWRPQHPAKGTHRERLDSTTSFIGHLSCPSFVHSLPAGRANGR